MVSRCVAVQVASLLSSCRGLWSAGVRKKQSRNAVPGDADLVAELFRGGLLRWAIRDVIDSEACLPTDTKTFLNSASRWMLSTSATGLTRRRYLRPSCTLTECSILSMSPSEI